MHNVLFEFRTKLSELMKPYEKSSRKIILIGFSYSGQYLRWYAKYYHGIDIEYIIRIDYPRVGADFENENLYSFGLFDYGIKEVDSGVVWMSVSYQGFYKDFLEEKGFVKGDNLVDFMGEIYGEDVTWPSTGGEATIPARRRKTGQRDIQELEWLEWKYGCNFIVPVPKEELKESKEHGAHYCVTTQKEIFEILDKAKISPVPEDGVFDFGCGKGGALVAFSEYGFKKIGGVEFDSDIYSVAKENFGRINLGELELNIIHGDASTINIELDKYNHFYFFDPFDEYIYGACLRNIEESFKRIPRMIKLICIYPRFHKLIEGMGYVKDKQLNVHMNQRIVNIYTMGV